VTAASVVLDRYVPEASAEALALERLCPQGRSIRLSFRRPTFHRRAERFGEHAIFTARQDGRLVGILSTAVKEVSIGGAPARAAFLFDLRVHPAARRQGIARTLSARAMEWGDARADVTYTYTMAENRAVLGMRRVFGSVDAAGYSYLVIPTRPAPPPEAPVERAGFGETHETMRHVRGALDLYARPGRLADGAGYRGSWMAGAGTHVAGCSAWDNHDVLAEVVESVPFPLRALDAVGRVLHAGWPRVPRAGEALRSWHLFDFFATEASRARDLVRHVVSEARASGVDFVYLIHDPGNPALRLIRAEYSGPFCPTLGYRLLVRGRQGAAPSIGSLYVDIRDL
jgi:GNAT superfamily N-acetyltransferase